MRYSIIIRKDVAGQLEMAHSKVDQALKIGIGVGLAALGFLIVNTMNAHVVKVGIAHPTSP